MRYPEFSEEVLDIETSAEVEPSASVELDEDFFKNLDENRYKIEKEDQSFFDFYRIWIERNAIIHTERELLDLADTNAEVVKDPEDAEIMEQAHKELPYSLNAFARELLKNKYTVPWFDATTGRLRSEVDAQTLKLISLEYGLEYVLQDRKISPSLDKDSQASKAIKEVRLAFNALRPETKIELSRLVTDREYLHQQIENLKKQAQSKTHLRAA